MNSIDRPEIIIIKTGESIKLIKSCSNNGIIWGNPIKSKERVSIDGPRIKSKR